MIVQSAAEGSPHFVLTMVDHLAFATKLGENFGNEKFGSVEPLDLMLYAIKNHDAGWKPLDDVAAIDREKGLPYNLIETPFDDRIRTTTGSPDAVAAHHPYCELIASMHTHGLYHGRLGVSDIVVLDLVDEDHRPALDKILGKEETRQKRLKGELAANPETAHLVEEKQLMQNYMQLQFFDTLCLYFQRAGEGDRGVETFPKVPISANEEVSVTVKGVSEGVYSFDPFPWKTEGLELSFEGRWIAPNPDHPEDNMADLMSNTDLSEQTVKFVSA